MGLDHVKPVTPVLCFKFKLDSARPPVQRLHSPRMHFDALPLLLPFSPSEIRGLMLCLWDVWNLLIANLCQASEKFPALRS